MAGALIVTAEMGEADTSALNALRQKYFPPERNHLRAHLTMFHALPPSTEPEVRSVMADLAREHAPKARLSALMDLGRGVAFRVESEELIIIRGRLADHFHGCLTSQDSARWRPHVTIQNKVERAAAVALLEALGRDFRPRPLTIRGLELHRYVGGPWEFLGRWRFRG